MCNYLFFHFILRFSFYLFISFMCFFFSKEFNVGMLKVTGDQELRGECYWPHGFSSLIFSSSWCSVVRSWRWFGLSEFVMTSSPDGVSSRGCPQICDLSTKLRHDASQESVNVYEWIQPAVIPKRRVLFTEHLSAPCATFSMWDAFYYMAASWSPERNTWWVNRIQGRL